MTQFAQPVKQNNYVSAGNNIGPFERIVVSNQVDLPDMQTEREETRVAFRAGHTTVARRFGIPLPLAVLLIALAVVIMSAVTLGTARQGRLLREEIEHLQNKYAAYEKECIALDEQLGAAKDSNFICYYASQNLGMKLALHEETIQVAAGSQYAANADWAGALGAMTGRR